MLGFNFVVAISPLRVAVCPLSVQQLGTEYPHPASWLAEVLHYWHCCIFVFHFGISSWMSSICSLYKYPLHHGFLWKSLATLSGLPGALTVHLGLLATHVTALPAPSCSYFFT